MGNMRAMEFAALVASGEITLDTALYDHLRCNHYPPIHVSFMPAAKRAIEACVDREPERMIELPNRDGRERDPEPAYAVAAGLHLGAFVAVLGEAQLVREGGD